MCDNPIKTLSLLIRLIGEDAAERGKDLEDYIYAIDGSVPATGFQILGHGILRT